MSKTLIFGHKKPDTDSVMSAIGLSYLKNSLGFSTEARVLGDINKESIYALNYFCQILDFFWYFHKSVLPDNNPVFELLLKLFYSDNL